MSCRSPSHWIVLQFAPNAADLHVLVIVDKKKIGHTQHCPRTTHACSRLMSDYEAFVAAPTHCNEPSENPTSGG
jgi:hypothetical protein